MIDIVKSIGEAMCGQYIDPDTGEDIGKLSPEGMVKSRVDLERYRQVLTDTKPDLIVELGTYSGRSALWFADTANCPVVTVDLYPHVLYDMWNRWQGRITQIVGSSTDPDVVSKVADHTRDAHAVMFILDSDHSAAHVRAEMDLYHKFVSNHCYMVVEDGLIRWMPWFTYEGNPLDAIEGFLAEHHDWSAAQEIEDMFPTTQFPSGWLIRHPAMAKESS